MTEVHGYGVETGDPDSLQREISRITATLQGALGEEVTILFDAHYPYHPSTGMVTHPLVVDGVVDQLLQDGRTVSVLPITTYWEDSDRCLSYLGYDQLFASREVTCLSPREGPRESRTVHIGDRKIVITIPQSITRDVLCIPTLRPGYPPSHPGGTWLLAQAALDREPTADEAIAVGASIQAAGILDATYATFDTPLRTETIFASEDLPALDYVASRFNTNGSSPVMQALHPRPPRQIGIQGQDIADPVSGQESSSNDSGMISRAYQTYASVSGDLVPPQMLSTDD